MTVKRKWAWLIAVYPKGRRDKPMVTYRSRTKFTSEEASDKSFKKSREAWRNKGYAVHNGGSYDHRYARAAKIPISPY